MELDREISNLRNFTLAYYESRRLASMRGNNLTLTITIKFETHHGNLFSISDAVIPDSGNGTFTGAAMMQIFDYAHAAIKLALTEAETKFDKL